ncbi:MAG: hypothetical protein ACI9DQ_000944, partial [Glaciecola sp.]
YLITILSSGNNILLLKLKTFAVPSYYLKH